MGQNFSSNSEKAIIQQELGPLGIIYQYTLAGDASNRSPYACAKIPQSLIPVDGNHLHSLDECEDKLVLIKVIPKSLAMAEERQMKSLESNNRVDENLHISLFYTLSQFYHISPGVIHEINSSYETYLQQFEEGHVLKLLNSIYMPKQASLPVLYGVYQSKRAFYVLLDYQNFTLDELLKFNKIILQKDDHKRRFLFYQIIQVLFFCHKSGFAHGKIKPSNILLNDMLWVSLIGQDILYTPVKESQSSENNISIQLPSLNIGENRSYRQNSTSSPPVSSLNLNSKRDIESDNSLTYAPTTNLTSNEDLSTSLILKWQRRELSNFEYLMALNEMAGRRLGDFQFHPILPWVIDFSSPTGEWRDLSKTKYRLNKGDQMLDFTFNSPDNPHHVTEPLSEITYFIYMARRTPIHMLKRYVRNHYEPKEYPLSMVRMFHWTPDECIPEYYTDPTVFRSIHPDMDDLELPEWATDAHDFVAKHREALESDFVSQQLHHWIDLIFGYKLSGPAAIAAKNVMLRKENNDIIPTRYGYVQLFKDPHPPRFSLIDKYDGDAVFVDEHELTFYEDTLEFSSTYFARPEYYIIPFLRRTKKKKVDASEKELYADDMFALGCLLAETYIFQPLFNSRSLDYYLSNPDQPKYKTVTELENISEPARSLVEALIDLDINVRKNAFRSPQAKRLFPPFFKYAYWFLSRFYTLPTLEDKYSFVIRHIIKESDLIDSDLLSSTSRNNPYTTYGGLLADLPSEGLEITLPHILQTFFSLKHSDFSASTNQNVMQHLEAWTHGVSILRYLGKNIEQYKLKSCVTMRKLVKKKLYELYLESDRMESRVMSEQDQEKLVELQLNLYSTSFSFFLYDIVMIEEQSGVDPQRESRKMYLEQILPFFIDVIFYRTDQRVTEKASKTLHRISKKYLGTVLTIQHIIEPTISRISRQYFSGRGKKDRISKKVVHTLINIGLMLGPSSMLSYYIPKLLKLILDHMRLIVKREESTDELSKLEDVCLSESILDIYDIFYYLMQRYSGHSPSSINSILVNNQQLLVDLLQIYARYPATPKDSIFDISSISSEENEQKSLIVRIYERFVQFLFHLLSMCDLNIRTQILQSMKGNLKTIFNSDVLLQLEQEDIVTENRVAESLTPIGRSRSDTIEDDSSKKQTSSIRSLVSRIKASVTSRTEPQALFNRKTSTPQPPLLRHVESEPEQISIDSPEPDPHESSDSIADQSPQSQQFTSKDDFLKACILYREMCRACFGNTVMRSAVSNSKYFEDYLSSTSDNEDARHSATDDGILKLEEDLSTHPLSSHWILQNPSTMQRVVSPCSGSSYDGDSRSSEYKFKGVLEYEFEDTGRFSAASTIRCIDALETDERIFVTGGREHNLPCVKFWNLESENSNSICTLYPYPSVSNKREITKVQFLDKTDGRITICLDSNNYSAYGNMHIYDTELNKLLYTIHGGTPGMHWYYNHTTTTTKYTPPVFSSIDATKSPHHIRSLSIGAQTTPHLLGPNSSGMFLATNIVAASTSLDHHQGQISAFDVSDQGSKVIVTTTSEGKLKFYDLRASQLRECYEWRIFPPSHQFARQSPLSSSVALKCVSACHQQDKYIAVGLSTGVVFLMEKRSGLILDSFEAHDKEIIKMSPYSASPGHLFTCSSTADADSKADLIRMWDTVHTVPAKCEKVFRLASQLQTSQAEVQPPHVTLRSFDIHSKTDCDHIFAVSNYSILHYKSHNLIAPSTDYEEKQAMPSKQRNRKGSRSQQAAPVYMNRFYQQQPQTTDTNLQPTSTNTPMTPMTQSANSFANISQNIESKLTDVKYFPLHKLLLATTSDGKIKVFS